MAATLAGAPKATRFAAASLTRSTGFVGADGAFRLQPSGLIDRSLAVLELQASGAVVIDTAATGAISPQAGGKSSPPAKNASL